MKRSKICDLLGIQYPIILGGMGGISDASLAAAVSNAGGLGTIASLTYSKEAIREEIDKARGLTTNPFAINVALFRPDASDIINAIIEKGVKIAITAAGSPRKFTETLKKAQMKVMHVVASVEMAKKAEEAGVDVVIAEGTESGGVASREEVATLPLIPQVIDSVKIPVIAAGGFGDARGYLAARALGAQGVQMGTVFLATKECTRISDTYKQMLLSATESSTAIVARKAFPMRMLKNRAYQLIEEADRAGKSPQEILTIISEFQKRQDNPEEGAFVCGQVAGLIKEIKSVQQVIHEIVEGAEAIYKSLA
ncbi:MAG: nitronate monooxygenase [Candidatus Tectomicrobia bacterium]|uniref:Nitronate monooxygenase n=1 Tax=Tectimicrobiota bacterium TaxID=2528274 RepID=A0A933LQB6_UNCTE|nr:nitronate monooxygenase [Candidatus Tectomicrobia bacterium]